MTSTRNSTVFRVTGLTTTQPDDVLAVVLKAAIHGNLLEEERSVIQDFAVIVPSCYDEESERVALVEFRGGVPKFLAELVVNPLENWQAEMDDDTDITFDRHFFGFTQLYAPKGDMSVTADIIAVTGLDGHAYDSWRGEGNLGRIWLRDFLSKDLPHCRTMIYGYNSKLSTHGVDTIMDYGRELMEEIKKIRNEKDLRQRPLFFIAHSFGGIILAHCLIKAVQTNKDDHPTIASLYNATYGILLFSTPHKGLLVNDIQKMLAGQKHPRNLLLQQISHQSDLLISQLADFKNLIRDRKVVSFYETETTRQLELDNKNRDWKRTGDFVVAVDTDSALLQLPDHIEDKIPLHADHSMIVKFDNKNAQGYRSALDRLKRFEQDAPRVVAARFSQALENRPKPVSTVPFQRDSMFVGREDIIADISKRHEQVASQNHSRVALVGLGGVGKSQIAIEYTYRVMKSTPQIWIFWIHANNAARFEQAYRDIAAKVELPERNDPKADILSLVDSWLCDERNGRWLIVLDSADDKDVFFRPVADLQAAGHASSASSGKMSLANFLPQTSNGWILVTSRDELAAINLVGNRHNVVRVEPMNEEDALALLKTRVFVGESSEPEARALVYALEYIPLAVTQAAAYIQAREPRIPISTYLELFQESEKNQVNLLENDEAGDLRRDPNVRHAVITTWQISFEQIRRITPAATDLLALMSMFDRQGIPEDLLHDSTDQLQFEDVIAPLISFSLIRTQIEQKTKTKLFEMHRLVQVSTRKWLELNNELDKWKKESLRSLAVAFPSGEYGTWAACQVLLPHSKIILSYLSYDENENENEVLNRAKIAYNTALYLYCKSEYVEAEKVGRVAVEGRERTLGQEHIDTLISVNLLGLVLTELGKLEEAEAIHTQLLEWGEKVLGPMHINTLSSIQNLSLVSIQMDRYQEAEALQRRALRGFEDVLGREHQDTLTCAYFLGSVLRDLGKNEEAEVMYRRALAGREKVLGREHPDILKSINGLGWVLKNLGRYEEAEAMCRQALKGSEKVLGPGHADTLRYANNLGVFLTSLHKYEEAEAMHRRALEGSEKVLGPEKSATLLYANNLGSLLTNLGKYEEAEAMHRRALEGNEKVLGLEHANTLHTVHSLAYLLHKMKRYNEASDSYQRALSGYRKVFGTSHPDLIKCDITLASMKQEMEQDECI